MTDKRILDKLKEWVNENYKPQVCGYTWERSEGNCCDCFDDGEDHGISWSAYQVGCILEMDLAVPDDEEEDYE